MAAKEPTLAELASMLGISQQAAQRHAKASGGTSSLAGKVLNAMSHILGGGSRRTLPDALPAEQAAPSGDAVSRLRAWIRDYSDHKQLRFIADLKEVLALAAKGTP